MAHVTGLFYQPSLLHNVMTEELDPTGKSPHEPGAKLDGGKAPIFQGVINYFPRALEAVAKVSAFGAQKYSWGGWGPVDDGINRYSNAQHRHAISAARGETCDPDSGMLHAAHEAWNALAKLELMLREKQ